MTSELGYGVIGAGWMGDVHARAMTRLTHHFPELAPRPTLLAVAEPLEESRLSFVGKHGDIRAYESWNELLGDPHIDLVSITTPNATHREIAVAAAAAGKHIWIEKPVGLTLADIEAIDAAATAAGVQVLVGFNYRHIPAVSACKRVINEGSIGQLTHARVWLLTDYAAHPGGPLSWRFTMDRGGHGVLGDLFSHAVDLTRFLTADSAGEPASTVAVTSTFISQRPIAPPGGSHYDIVAETGSVGTVENEDYVAALVTTSRGLPVVMESSRADAGEENNYGFEIHGTHGLVSWDYRRSDEYRVSTGHAFQHQEVRTFFAGPGDGEYARFSPGPGNAMSYDDTKVCEAAGVVRSVRGGHSEGPDLSDARAAAALIEAVITSSATRAWVSLPIPIP